MFRVLWLCGFFLPSLACAQDIPAGGLNCDLRAPPEAAAKGIHPPRRLPMRLFPVKPGAQYTGCQWIWISYGTPSTWDYWSVTYYEAGVPRIQRIRFPPLPVQSTVQTCVYAAADGRARRLVEGNDWQQDCRGANELRNLLVVTPKENDVWDFF
jgi:hypothetical protein